MPTLEQTLMTKFGIRKSSALVITNMARQRLQQAGGVVTPQALLEEECMRLCRQEEHDRGTVRDSAIFCGIKEEGESDFFETDDEGSEDDEQSATPSSAEESGSSGYYADYRPPQAAAAPKRNEQFEFGEEEDISHNVEADEHVIGSERSQKALLLMPEEKGARRTDSLLPDSIFIGAGSSSLPSTSSNHNYNESMLLSSIPSLSSYSTICSPLRQRSSIHSAGTRSTYSSSLSSFGLSSLRSGVGGGALGTFMLDKSLVFREDDEEVAIIQDGAVQLPDQQIHLVPVRTNSETALVDSQTTLSMDVFDHEGNLLPQYRNHPTLLSNSHQEEMVQSSIFAAPCMPQRLGSINTTSDAPWMLQQLGSITTSSVAPSMPQRLGSTTTVDATGIGSFLAPPLTKDEDSNKTTSCSLPSMPQRMGSIAMVEPGANFAAEQAAMMMIDDDPTAITRMRGHHHDSQHPKSPFSRKAGIAALVDSVSLGGPSQLTTLKVASMSSQDEETVRMGLPEIPCSLAPQRPVRRTSAEPEAGRTEAGRSNGNAGLPPKVPQRRTSADQQNQETQCSLAQVATSTTSVPPKLPHRPVSVEPQQQQCGLMTVAAAAAVAAASDAEDAVDAPSSSGKEPPKAPRRFLSPIPPLSGAHQVNGKVLHTGLCPIPSLGSNNPGSSTETGEALSNCM